MKNDYYVYVYLNQLKPGNWIYKNKVFLFEPFYVGKGRNKREIIHLTPCMLKKKSKKNSVIKNIFSQSGELPVHFRIYENLTDKEAIDIEKSFINCFGRIDNGTGILSNHTDGGDGANNFSEEILKKLGAKKKIYQYDLKGNFLKEWDSIISTEEIFGNSGNISTAIKRNGTAYDSIWSYDYKEKLESKIKYQMPVKYKNICQLNKNTNEEIEVFADGEAIEKKLKLRKKARNKIYECINGTLKTAYGFKWKLK